MLLMGRPSGRGGIVYELSPSKASGVVKNSGTSSDTSCWSNCDAFCH